jgi:hypothetical protein
MDNPEFLLAWLHSLQGKPQREVREQMRKAKVGKAIDDLMANGHNCVAILEAQLTLLHPTRVRDASPVRRQPESHAPPEEGAGEPTHEEQQQSIILAVRGMSGEVWYHEPFIEHNGEQIYVDQSMIVGDLSQAPSGILRANIRDIGECTIRGRVLDRTKLESRPVPRHNNVSRQTEINQCKRRLEQLQHQFTKDPNGDCEFARCRQHPDGNELEREHILDFDVAHTGQDGVYRIARSKLHRDQQELAMIVCP